MPIRDLAPAFNARFGTAKSYICIKAALNNHRIKCGRGYGEHLMPESNIFSAEQIAFLKDNYRELSLRDLAAAFAVRFPEDKRTTGQIRSFLHNHGVNSGRTGYFEKGHESWNKGTKGLTGRNRTTFAKGNVPSRTKPIGFERVNKYGYIEIKIEETNPYTGCPTRFKLKHIVVWERNFGPVPEGMVVAFKDADPLKCEPGNLMLVSRLELMKLNGTGYKDAPDEVKPSLLALAKLEAKAGIRTYRLKNGRKVPHAA